MQSWPSNLPDLNVDGFSEVDADAVVRFATEAGPEHVRQRYTAVVSQLSNTLVLSGSEVETLLAFFRVTLARGAVPFDWVNPRTEAAVVMRMKGPPAISGGPDSFSVRINLEILP